MFVQKSSKKSTAISRAGPEPSETQLCDATQARLRRSQKHSKPKPNPKNQTLKLETPQTLNTKAAQRETLQQTLNPKPKPYKA